MKLADLLRALLACPPIPAARCGVRGEEDKRSQLLQQINFYVRDNLDKPITIEALAGSLGYPASYARAVFREALGVSLGRYIRESRLAEAAQLLREPSVKRRLFPQRNGATVLYVSFSVSEGPHAPGLGIVDRPALSQASG